MLQFVQSRCVQWLLEPTPYLRICSVLFALSWAQVKGLSNKKSAFVTAFPMVLASNGRPLGCLAKFVAENGRQTWRAQVNYQSHDIVIVSSQT